MTLVSIVFITISISSSSSSSSDKQFPLSQDQARWRVAQTGNINSDSYIEKSTTSNH